ncbi:hypothetical protein BHF71_10325 [Vulcanibacillus modesticaldus]|uniref:GIY-YIG domain-containing protein n=1 Tax=Vulcanibacillus modesticaldus TaxID=337097 RepID=A0A1D2YT16_9BACI|nr:hypothetical protein [Vulcanibacillus modesticaldus]OEF98819.1 hypothetical protein BHF71_10325 [Vulcanibacillus modesticaldus]
MNKRCADLHYIFNNLNRFYFPFNEQLIPQNGIYILFEKGERCNGLDRIVRIGTHTGNNQLRSRLIQHFIDENKDRSIFRKNIGRALLNMRNDDYLKVWELDLTSKKNKQKYNSLVDKDYQNKIEIEVSKIIQDNFSFVVFEENDKENRLFLESKIIAEISKCSNCKPSSNWLGKYSTKEKIRESGLWQVNNLYKKGFSEQEFIQFKNRFLQ